MTTPSKHVCVCVCTYKRPDLLARLLEGLWSQDIDDRFTYSIVIVDNDRLRSAEPVVQTFASKSTLSITYSVEARQNISLARNKAVENACGDFVAFLDDDEFPTKNWLLTLFNACEKYGVDGVLGPVKPHFDQEPPSWVVQGQFYDRPSYPTGFVIDGKKGRTGNVLLKRSLFEAGSQPFRPECLSGEDQDFFGRMIAKGHRFIWCAEALAYEVVPPIRWKRTFVLRRALLSGATSLAQPTFGARDIVKSIVALPAYAVGLPFALVLGHGHFMVLLAKLFDHAGRLLALAGIDPIGKPYVTE